MTNPNDGAHPCKFMGNLDGMVEQLGLTKREWFAGLVLQGIIASGNLRGEQTTQRIVQDSLEFADALIAELSK